MSNISPNAEIELLKRKIAEQQELIQNFMKTETHLVPLPNGDLHRGFRKAPGSVESNIDVEHIADEMGNPLDRAMAKVLQAARDGQPLTCLWCGLQWGANSEPKIRDHLKSSHPSVVDGWEKLENQILMQNLSEANARLEAVTKK